MSWQASQAVKASPTSTYRTRCKEWYLLGRAGTPLAQSMSGPTLLVYRSFPAHTRRDRAFQYKSYRTIMLCHSRLVTLLLAKGAAVLSLCARVPTQLEGDQ